jgi:hypothetical protein
LDRLERGRPFSDQRRSSPHLDLADRDEFDLKARAEATG